MDYFFSFSQTEAILNKILTQCHMLMSRNNELVLLIKSRSAHGTWTPFWISTRCGFSQCELQFNCVLFFNFKQNKQKNNNRCRDFSLLMTKFTVYVSVKSLRIPVFVVFTMCLRFQETNCRREFTSFHEECNDSET